MSERLNWGVMGNATIARVCVIPAIQKSRNGTVLALASRSPRQAGEVIGQHQIPRVYGDYDALIQDPAIDAIYLPLPNHLHHPWSLAALAAGKHVLCEKPIACNAREAEEMATAAQRADRLLMEAFMYRFHPRSLQIRELVRTGEIGPARLVRSAFCYRMDSKDANNPDIARLKPEMGGGALLDVGCYGVSVARWLFDADPIEVQCQAVFHTGGVDLHTAGVMAFSDGRLATVEASMIAGLQQTFTVVGEKGSIDLPQDAFIPWEKDALFTLRGNGNDSAAATVVDGVDEYRLMVEHFADAVMGIASPAASMTDSIANMHALDALSKAAKSGKKILL